MKYRKDNGKIVGAVRVNISKVFNCIPHDLFIGKLIAYGLNEDESTLYPQVKKDHIVLTGTSNNPFSTAKARLQMAIIDYV